ncbi:hypothetical protein [Hymenobacter cellulosivorans]|uniref:Uncharacterized protein n=1 Tax=Hymenobacter cellulosivorans TaxID=2932249 RepID=A0ABY4FE26_9BACT|nr:hypothetical protein [Hymenobacter cellulosivorans]UOQ54227.1 hypothetical protein MUN80_05595 [Hymenobacter cellulosivorans]
MSNITQYNKNTGNFSQFIKNARNINVSKNYSSDSIHALTKKQAININKDYWSLIIDNKSKWPFEKNYYYKLYGKSIVNNKVVALFYTRSFFPKNIEKEATETVIATFSYQGKLIDSLPIQGSIGDDLNFVSIIRRDYKITTNYESYVNNQRTTYTKAYIIEPSGLITSL